MKNSIFQIPYSKFHIPNSIFHIPILIGLVFGVIFAQQGLSKEPQLIFKEARQWQIAADAAAVEALIAYGEGTVTIPRYRIWDGSAWGAELDALDVGGQINWVVTKANPTRDEYILATIDTLGVAKAQIYSEGSWGNLQTLATVANADRRGLDIVYETNSGDAIVVVADGDADPTWWSWNGTSWNASGTVDLSTIGNCEWIKLASDPNSDEIILIAQDASRYYRAQVWDGSLWGNEFSAGTVTSPAAGDEAMAIEYETSGNQALIVYANGTAASFYWNSWDGAAWGTAATVSIGDDFKRGTLKADPNSDELILSYVDTDNDIGTVIWSGTAWGAYSELETLGAINTDRCVDAEFESISGHSGHILVAYYQDQPLVVYQLWYFKDQIYYVYGGSSEIHRNLMAANLLMWEAIKLGKKLGAKQFDMWGSLPPNYDQNHPWAGFTKFKEGYGTKFTELVGSYDLLINPFLYQLYNYGYFIRNIYLSLRRLF